MRYILNTVEKFSFHFYDKTSLMKIQIILHIYLLIFITPFYEQDFNYDASSIPHYFSEINNLIL